VLFETVFLKQIFDQSYCSGLNKYFFNNYGQIKKRKMKRRVIIVMALLFISGIAFVFLTKAKADPEPPTKYCWYNPIEEDCDTGGNCVCYDIYPPDCRQND